MFRASTNNIRNALNELNLIDDVIDRLVSMYGESLEYLRERASRRRSRQRHRDTSLTPPARSFHIARRNRSLSRSLSRSSSSSSSSSFRPP